MMFNSSLSVRAMSRSYEPSCSSAIISSSVMSALMTRISRKRSLKERQTSSSWSTTATLDRMAGLIRFSNALVILLAPTSTMLFGRFCSCPTVLRMSVTSSDSATMDRVSRAWMVVLPDGTMTKPLRLMDAMTNSA
ncbi:hypothetical protein DSECCO2_612200 [anaerobic digester metagenome]